MVGWSVGWSVGWLVGRLTCLLACLLAGWLVGDAEPIHPAEAPSAPPGGGDRSGGAFRTPRGRRSREKRVPPSPAIPTLNRSHEKHAPPPRQHPPSTREARSTDPSSTYPQHMKGYRRKTEAGNETTLKENGPYSRSMPSKRRKHAPKPATRGWKNIPLLIERFRRLWKTLKTWNSFENRCGKISKHAFSDCSKP